MESKIKQQQNITDYFQTISQSSNKRTTKGKSLINNNDDAIQKKKLSTPKRSHDETTSTTTLKSVPTAKKLKRTTALKQIKTDHNVKSRNKIVYGPTNIIRKLDFNDCIDNNNNDDGNTFKNFLKSNNNNDDNDKTPMMKPDDIKTRLQSCKNLTKLKEQLININECGEKIRKFKEMKIKYQENLNKNNNNNSGSPKKLNNSPVKSILLSSPIKSKNLFNNNNLKAPKKDKNNNQEEEQELKLPIIYKRLFEIFKLINYNSWRMYKRQEICTFDKLKQIIEHSTHRTFTIDLLLKILTIINDNKNKLFHLSWDIYMGELKLILTPIYNQDNYNNKCLNQIGLLLEREKLFKNFLLELTRIEHLKFLTKMKLDLKNLDNGDNVKIYRWHPMFPLDKINDNIEIDYTLLPNKPKIDTTIICNSENNKLKKTTILDYFPKKKSLINNSTIVDNKSTKDDNNNNILNNKNDNNKNIIESGLLKGISKNLLDKIRAKEAAKLTKLMCRSPEKEMEIRILSKLMDISRIIYDCFIDKTTIRSIEKSDLIERISQSMPMTINETRRHFDYLCRFEFDDSNNKWLRIIQLRNMEYVQIDNRYPLSELCMAFRKRMQHLQSN